MKRYRSAYLITPVDVALGKEIKRGAALLRKRSDFVVCARLLPLELVARES